MRRAFLAFAAALSGVALFLVPSVASGATTSCIGPQGAVTINGNVSAGAGCALNGTTVTGNVSVGSGGSLATNGATIGGNLQIVGTSGANTICGTSVGGNLDVHNNSGSTAIGGGSCFSSNTVGGNVNIHNNSGPVTVSNTSVQGNLDCHNDSPAAATGGGNFVNGKSKGECQTSLTTKCPSTGCDPSTSNGDTSVTVHVPGGGNKGNLTITLSPPPSDDGCGQESSPIGSIVTVNPPSGYTAENPIVVTITYTNLGEEEGSVSSVCKSNNGNPPFTALPICDFGEESTPNNVPCFTAEGDTATVYMTSNDPAFNGH